MLTNVKCKTAKVSDKVQKLFDAGGLYLEVTPRGGKYWRLKYRFNCKEKKLAISAYPTITLSEARSTRDNAKKSLAIGIDPSDEKQKLKKERFISSSNSK